jgi:hypothetical protein
MKQKCRRFRLVKGKIVWSKTFAMIDAVNERDMMRYLFEKRK